MRASATVNLKITSEKHIELILKSLRPEVNDHRSARSRVDLERSEPFLVLKVEARDTTALRASLNTYLRWVDSTLRVLKLLETERS